MTEAVAYLAETSRGKRFHAVVPGLRGTPVLVRDAHWYTALCGAAVVAYTTGRTYDEQPSYVQCGGCRRALARLRQ